MRLVQFINVSKAFLLL